MYLRIEMQSEEIRQFAVFDETTLVLIDSNLPAHLQENQAFQCNYRGRIVHLVMVYF